MKIERRWAMPSMHTFKIKPISDLLDEEMGSGMFVHGLWCDPFAGENSRAQETNDLNPAKPTKYHMDALEFLEIWPDEHFDGVLYDPPYSARQVKECYEAIGMSHWDGKTTFWSDTLDECVRILKPGGKLVCFGWSSGGAGKRRGMAMTRALLVPHGSRKNDTIVTVESKL